MGKCLGVFDSGIGGLTVLKELIKLNKYNNIIYFGDTGRVPYGTRSSDTIISYADQDVRFLLDKGADEIAIACGTVSAIALDTLRSQFRIPIVGVIDAAVGDAVKATKNGIIAVIGTSATIRSGVYEKKITDERPDISVINVECPLFVPLVEYGFALDPGDPTVMSACDHYLKEIKSSGADTIILGCTHYPILAGHIRSYLGEINMINIGRSLAGSMQGGSAAAKPDIRYFVSDDAQGFCRNASLYLGKSIHGSVQWVDIQNY